MIQVSAPKRSWVLAFCLMTVAYAALVPVLRARMLIQVSYNEGWNVYNASTVAHHGLLYPVPYGWTSVNYPILSFYIVAALHSFTHDFLFTARVLSILGTLLCGLFAGLTVWSVTRSRWHSLLAGLFCLALFCADAERYVALADPQMFAQVFFMAGLFVYARFRQRTSALMIVALLFVLGGNIKHSLLEFPIAVVVDLWLTSRRKAILFCAVGGMLVAFTVALNIHFGGPYFLSCLLAGRGYTFIHALDNLAEGYGPVVLPMLIATIMAIRFACDARRRVFSLLFGAALAIDVVFGGGRGVWINVTFGGLLAAAILVGLFLHDLDTGETRMSPLFSWLAPVVLFAWLVIPLIVTGNWRPVRELKEAHKTEARFAQETQVLAQQAGPALCESLLRCYFAQKPYVYDPFNATRLIQLKHLDPTELERKLETQEFGAVQMDRPAELQMTSGPGKERFDPAILRAVETNYVAAMQNEDGVIYVPRSRPLRAQK